MEVGVGAEVGVAVEKEGGANGLGGGARWDAGVDSAEEAPRRSRRARPRTAGALVVVPGPAVRSAPLPRRQPPSPSPLPPRGNK